MTAEASILFIAPTVACYVGGTETVVTQLAQRIKGRARLALLSGDPGGERKVLIDAGGFDLLTLPFAGRDSGRNRFFSKLLMTSPFKIESWTFFRSLARSGIDLARYDRIVTFHEADAYLLSRRYPALRARFRHFLPGVGIRGFFKRVPARDVYFFGYRAAPRVKRKWGIDIQSLPLGVDTMFFPAAPPRYPGSRRLIFVGRLDASKQVDWLAEFFAQSGLAQRGYHLDIVGDGPLLEGLLARYGKSHTMTFHGRQRQESVADILRGSFALLHPTAHESFGLTVLEAMAAGVPVITHELDSIAAWAREHPRYAAYLDRTSWAAEIGKLEQAAHWEAVSRSGLEFARSFTWDRVAERVLGLILGQPAS